MRERFLLDGKPAEVRIGALTTTLVVDGVVVGQQREWKPVWRWRFSAGDHVVHVETGAVFWPFVRIFVGDVAVGTGRIQRQMRGLWVFLYGVLAAAVLFIAHAEGAYGAARGVYEAASDIEARTPRAYVSGLRSIWPEVDPELGLRYRAVEGCVITADGWARERSYNWLIAAWYGEELPPGSLKDRFKTKAEIRDALAGSRPISRGEVLTFHHGGRIERQGDDVVTASTVANPEVIWTGHFSARQEVRIAWPSAESLFVSFSRETIHVDARSRLVVQALWPAKAQ